jgi:hypothetical protein
MISIHNSTAKQFERSKFSKSFNNLFEKVVFFSEKTIVFSLSIKIDLNDITSLTDDFDNFEQTSHFQHKKSDKFLHPFLIHPFPFGRKLKFDQICDAISISGLLQIIHSFNIPLTIISPQNQKKTDLNFWSFFLFQHFLLSL